MERQPTITFNSNNLLTGTCLSQSSSTLASPKSLFRSTPIERAPARSSVQPQIGAKQSFVRGQAATSITKSFMESKKSLVVHKDIGQVPFERSHWLSSGQSSKASSRQASATKLDLKMLNKTDMILLQKETDRLARDAFARISRGRMN